MLLLSQYDRQELKMASSGLEPERFCRLPEQTREEYVAAIDEVVRKIVKRNPEAFKEKALINHRANIKRIEERNENESSRIL
jgi:hypothetical protein